MAAEQSAVTWAVRILEDQQPEEIPPGIQILPFETDYKPGASRIVFSAKSEGQSLEGATPFPVTVKGEFFWTLKDATQFQTIARAIKDAFASHTNPVLASAGEDLFDYFEIISVRTDDPEAKKESRKWQIEIELLVHEI